MVHFVAINKHSRQLKIKKFQNHAKEIRIGADREVSSGAHGLKVIATDLSEVESAICEVSNGHCTTSTCTTDPLCHDPSRRIACIERRTRAVAAKSGSLDHDAAAKPAACTRQDASSLTAVALPFRPPRGKPDMLACPLDLMLRTIFSASPSLARPAAGARHIG